MPRKPTTAAPNLVDTLERLKSFTEFESVTVAPDGTVSVKYAGKAPVAPKPRLAESPVKKTAIDSLSLTAPPFSFNGN